MSMPCDGPPCTCGALKMRTGKARFEAIPDLTPFEVECLRASSTDDPFEWLACTMLAHEAEQNIDGAMEMLVDEGLVTRDWYGTPAGRAVLIALGVS